MYNPIHPIRDVLRMFTKAEPPLFVFGYDFSDLTEKEAELLQNWAAYNVLLSWLPGIGTLEAAEKLVAEAVGCCMLSPKPEGYLYPDLEVQSHTEPKLAVVAILRLGKLEIRVEGGGTKEKVTATFWKSARSGVPHKNLSEFEVPIAYLKRVVRSEWQKLEGRSPGAPKKGGR